MASKSPVSNIKKYLKLEQNIGQTNVYLLVGKDADNKIFVKFNDSTPLSPCVMDYSCFCYVFFVKDVVFLKSHEFVVNICLNEEGQFTHNIPLPKKYIEDNLTDEERKKIKDILILNDETEYNLFQTANFNEK